MKKLKKIFSHSFGERLWRIIPSYGVPALFIEARDEKNVIITIYIYTGGSELKQVRPVDMPWWSTMISARPEIILTRSYGGEGNASEVELIAYDSTDGSRKWNLHDVMLIEEGSDWLRINRNGNEEILDPVSGNIADHKEIMVTDENNQGKYPFRYVEGTRYFDTVASFLERKNYEVPIKAIDYYEYNDKIVISCFNKTEDDLMTKLYVFDLDGNVCLEEETGFGLKGITDNTFFIFSGNLIFVTSRNDFFEYSLA